MTEGTDGWHQEHFKYLSSSSVNLELNLQRVGNSFQLSGNDDIHSRLSRGWIGAVWSLQEYESYKREKSQPMLRGEKVKTEEV